MRVLDQHAVRAHLDDLPRVRAEQEDVARQRLGDELLVQRADFQIGLGHVDVVEPGVLDRSTRGQREESRAAARVQAVVHAIPQHARRHAFDLVGQGLGHRADDLAERLARQRAIRRRLDEALPQRVGIDRLGGDGGDDLLREHVEWRVGHRHAIERALVDRPHDRRGLHQLLALGDDEAPLRHARERVAGAAHALKRRRHVARRLQLHHEVDRPDVDAELERRRRHQRFELAILQPVLGLQACAARQRAVMRGHAAIGDAIVEVSGQSFRRSPALSEDQRRAVRLDQLRHLLQGRVPDGVAGGREEIVDRRDDGHVEVAREAGVHHDGLVRGGAGDERQRLVDRPHRGRAADALRTWLAGVLHERL